MIWARPARIDREREQDVRNAIWYCLIAESAASPVFTEAEQVSGNIKGNKKTPARAKAFTGAVYSPMFESLSGLVEAA